jgi:hypothetical protein
MHFSDYNVQLLTEPQVTIHASNIKWPLKKLGLVGPKALWERYKKVLRTFFFNLLICLLGLTLQLLSHLKEMDKHLQVRYLGLKLGHKLALHSEHKKNITV